MFYKFHSDNQNHTACNSNKALLWVIAVMAEQLEEGDGDRSISAACSSSLE